MPAAPRLRGSALAGALLLAATLGLFFSPLFSPDAVLVIRDIPFLHLPLRTTFAELARSALPQWDPRIHGGQPILSNPHYAAFYPTSWLALAVPPHVAINLTILLHVPLAFAGAWRLARRLGCRPAAAALAAVAYAAGGTHVSLTGTLLLFTGMAWFPWLLAWADEILRPGAPPGLLPAPLKLGAGLALQILNGDPASVVVTGLALLALGVESLARWPERQRRWRRAAAAIGLAALLASVQALPTLMRLRETARAEGFGLARATVWSTRPLRLVEMVFPHAFGDPMRDEENLYFGWRLHDRQYPFLISLYVGLLPLLLAVAALAAGRLPYRASWIALVAAGLVLGLGRHNPLYPLLHAGLPWLAGLRYPEKFLMLCVLVLPFPAACGLERLLAERGETGRRRPRLALVLSASVFAVAIGLATAGVRWPAAVEHFVRAHSGLPPSPATVATGVAFLQQEAWLAAAVAAAVLAWLLVARGTRLSERVLVALALTVVLADLWLYGHRFQAVMPASEFLRPPPLAEQAQAGGGRLFTDVGFYQGPAIGPRIGRPGLHQLLALRARLEPYTGNLWRLEYALHEDFDVMMTSWARLPLWALHADWHHRERRLRLLGAWSAGALLHVLQPRELLAELARTSDTPLPGRLETNPYVLPRWRFVTSAVSHSGAAAALTAARDAEYALAEREHLITPGSGPAGRVTAYAAAELLAAEERANRVHLRYRAADRALLVAAMTFDVGWSAWVNGDPVPLVPTAIGQIAAELPAGEHTVELRFRDPWVAVGASLSLVGLLVGLLAFLRGRRRPGREAPA